MQQYAGVYLHVSGVYRTHYQEYIKLLLQLLVQVISRVRATTFHQRGLIYCKITLHVSGVYRTHHQ